ncbi:hypothetical protein HXX76_014504 [Chlamydomonas incerta]|uniref:Uncharacterized protein n=1 Tax=Chlamydomonas incerta TaxID=51695 RepID=A0A835VT74_CHLIN|nr:hypothetical protein HXX76_014504 [Chlamydomonas incerta]|eukprot:KAG2424451.1 hypothetical protein HXX76_014504 [Chlamydomonas incerta]
MEEGEKLQKELDDIGAEIARVSAQAESAKDAEDKRYFREKELMLRKERLMLLEARAAAAGLGVGSAAGAAAGPGPGSTAADVHPIASSMVAALLRMPAVPGPGELLSLGPNVVFQFQPDFSALYVRECYPRLFDALVCDEKPTKYIVTGTPGVGKSWFVTYLILRLLKRSSPPPFIVWEHFMHRGKAWCYVHETGQVVVGQLSSFEQLLYNPATWYIVDGAPPLFNILARTVLLTSPKRETFKMGAGCASLGRGRCSAGRCGWTLEVVSQSSIRTVSSFTE